MKIKLKRMLAALSAAAMLFTTAAVLPEKIPDFGGITASAEETGHAEKQDTDVVSVTAADGKTTYYDSDSLDSVFADSGNNDAIITLLADVERTGTLYIKINCTLDLNGMTIKLDKKYGVAVLYTLQKGNLTIQDSSADKTGAILGPQYGTKGLYIGAGTVSLTGGTFSGYDSGVYINSSYASLSVSGNVVISGENYGLHVSAYEHPTIQLSGGTYQYTGDYGFYAISGSNDQTVKGYLDTTQNENGKYYAYFDGNTLLTEGIDGIVLRKQSVTVGDCTHTFLYENVEGTNKHSKICPACGNTEMEAHQGGTATCQEKAVCEICEMEYGEYKEHNHTKVEATPPTCIANGNIEYWQCSECKKYFSDETCTTETTLEKTVIEATGHNYDNGKCGRCGIFEDGIGRPSGACLSLSGNIGVNFFMELGENVIADENAYMYFTLPNGDKQQIKVSEAQKREESRNTYYVFSCEVSAKEMDSKITAQIITSNGEGTVYEYSVKEYVDSVSENQSDFDEKTIGLVNAMANYGDYAKAYFSDEDLAATAEMNSVTADALAKYEKKDSGELPEGITYYGSSLILESNTTLRHYFKVADGADVSQCNFSGSKGNYRYIDIANISAGSLFDTHITTVGDYTIEYGPMTYVQAVLSSDLADEALKNTLKALYLYGQSAQAYTN